jgi:hypothetical protein
MSRWNEFVPRSSAAMCIEGDCNGEFADSDAPAGGLILPDVAVRVPRASGYDRRVRF